MAMTISIISMCSILIINCVFCSWSIDLRKNVWKGLIKAKDVNTSRFSLLENINIITTLIFVCLSAYVFNLYNITLLLDIHNIVISIISIIKLSLMIAPLFIIAIATASLSTNLDLIKREALNDN